MMNGIIRPEDVERASRADLEEAYYNLYGRFEALSVKDEDWRAYQAAFNPALDPQAAKTLCMLSSGRAISRASLLAVIALRDPGDLADDKMATVVVLALRKVLKPFGISIRTIWGFGYVMDPPEIAKVKALLAGQPCAAVPKTPKTQHSKGESSMGYLTDGLSFNTLRAGNSRRVGEFKTKDGKIAHDKSDGSDWTLLEWGGAASGELGELNNLLKKVRRGDFTIDEIRGDVANEIADVIIYLDLLAFQAGINLGEAVMATFNIKSAQQDIEIFLHPDDWHTRPRGKEKVGGYQ